MKHSFVLLCFQRNPAWTSPKYFNQYSIYQKSWSLILKHLTQKNTQSKIQHAHFIDSRKFVISDYRYVNNTHCAFKRRNNMINCKGVQFRQEVILTHHLITHVVKFPMLLKQIADCKKQIVPFVLLHLQKKNIQQIIM